MKNKLYEHPLFQIKTERLRDDERIALAYRRAKLVVQTYDLGVDDILSYSPKYWEFHKDPIKALDSGMFIIMTIHFNLAIGTLAHYLPHRPDLVPLVEELLSMETVGLFLLSERGHGLDAFNLETTATKDNDGFILHTPREESFKFMPATTPLYGNKKVAMVMARLIVSGEDRGMRLFLVPICSNYRMYLGVESIPLPSRSGSSPLDFAITRFDHVRLPYSALLGPLEYTDEAVRGAEDRPQWWTEVWRIQLGSLSVAASFIPSLKMAAYISGMYSIHRTIGGKNHEPVPIISFKTQQWAVVQALSVSMVLDNWYGTVTALASDHSVDRRVQHGLAAIGKTVILRHFETCVRMARERCGAQGTFEHNFMTRAECDIKGCIIAEGDIQVLCIRLFSELLLGRYEMPLPSSDEHLLARRAHDLFSENMSLLKGLSGHHRSEDFNALILPQAEHVIQAMGDAMAYSAAIKSGLPRPIVDAFECAVVRRDPAWFAERASISRMEQRLREKEAIEACLPQLTAYLDELGVHQYVSAPIVSDESWKGYLGGLPACSSERGQPSGLVPRALL